MDVRVSTSRRSQAQDDTVSGKTLAEECAEFRALSLKLLDEIARPLGLYRILDALNRFAIRIGLGEQEERRR